MARQDFHITLTLDAGLVDVLGPPLGRAVGDGLLSVAEAMRLLADEIVASIRVVDDGGR